MVTNFDTLTVYVPLKLTEKFCTKHEQISYPLGAKDRAISVYDDSIRSRVAINYFTAVLS